MYGNEQHLSNWSLHVQMQQTGLLGEGGGETRYTPKCIDTLRDMVHRGRGFSCWGAQQLVHTLSPLRMPYGEGQVVHNFALDMSASSRGNGDSRLAARLSASSPVNRRG